MPVAPMPTTAEPRGPSAGEAPPLHISPPKQAVQAPIGALDAQQITGFFSQEGAARQQGCLRSLAGQFAGIPGIVSLSGGFPPPSLFPLSGLTLHLASGGSVDIKEPAAVSASQQYNFSLRGWQPLLEWAEAHVADMHSPPPAAGHTTLITNGGNHTLEMIFALFMDRGDSLLLEEYSYPVVTESLAQPKGVKALPLPIDEHGIVPDRLEQLLEELKAGSMANSSSSSSDSSSSDGSLSSGGGNSGGSTAPVKFPKLLYTVPTGQNPTGCTITSERRQAVYRLCQRYNLLLVEDDPYFFLQYPQGPDAVPGLQGLRGAGSYLSLDTDGRVIRVDSFAKFLAPGLRLGWVTAHPLITDKLTMTIQSHTVGPCSLTQVLTAEMLKAWGDEGLHAHLHTVQHEYAQRAEWVMAACQEHLSGLAEWSVPSAGMFLWLRLLVVQDSGEVWEALKAAKVVLLPGRAMHCRCADPSFHSPFLRLSYSNASAEDLREGMRRLGQVLREHAAKQAGTAQQPNGSNAANTSMQLG